MRERLRRLAKQSVVARFLTRQYRLRTRLPRWRDAPAAKQGGGRVLIATGNGAYLDGVAFESLLAAALRNRGADVDVLLCDRALNACMECSVDRVGTSSHFIRHGPSRLLCPGCTSAGTRTFAPVAEVHTWSRFRSEADDIDAASAAAAVHIDGVASLEVDGLPIGEHALAGALRFFARATLEGEPDADAVVRRYVQAAVVSARVARRALEALRPDVVVLHHGIYVPQGIFAAVSRQLGVRVVTWNPAYRSGCFIASHGDTYHRTMLDEPPDDWLRMPWDKEREAELVEYVKSRSVGTQDWIHFIDRPERNPARIAETLGIDRSKPCIGLLTNVMWDAQLLYRQNAFENMREWVLDTVRWFATRPEVQLLIRVHPAEVKGNIPSRQPIIAELDHALGDLPPNVFVVPPDSEMGTYAAMELCDTVLVYATKAGVELAALGTPVVVAGEAWVRGKGFTIDVASREEYLDILARLPLGRRLEGDQLERARRYAFHFFFRRMIPVSVVEPTGHEPRFRPTTADPTTLSVGASPGLDVICEGVLRGSPFVYDEARLRSA